MKCAAVTSKNGRCKNIAKINIYCGVHTKTNHTYIMYKNIKIKKINARKYFFLLNYEKYIRSNEGALIESKNDIDIILNKFNELNEDNMQKELIYDMISNLIKEQRIEKIEREKIEIERIRLEKIEKEKIEIERIRLEKIEKEKKELERLEKEKLEQERLIQFKKINECKCCFGEYIHSELIHCDKANIDNVHLICTDCMKRYVNVAIEKSQINLKCVYDDTDHCNGFYKEETFKSVLNEEEYNKFIDLYEISEVRQIASIISNYQICPKCRKFGIQIDSKEKLSVKCGKCLSEWCSKCQKQSHKQDCNYIEISNIKKENLESYIDNILIEIRNKTIMHTCPHCNSTFIKEEGCNLIKCSTCNGHSCYLCGIKIYSLNDSYYHHFKGHVLNQTKSECELWNGKDGSTGVNQNWNNVKLVQNYKNLISINSNELRPIIYNKLLKIHSKDNLKNEIKKIGRELRIDTSCNIL